MADELKVYAVSETDHSRLDHTLAKIYFLELNKAWQYAWELTQSACDAHGVKLTDVTAVAGERGQAGDTMTDVFTPERLPDPDWITIFLPDPDDAPNDGLIIHQIDITRLSPA